MVAKKKLLNIIKQGTSIRTSIEICQKKKRKQKVNIPRIDITKREKNQANFVKYKNELLLVQ